MTGRLRQVYSSLPVPCLLVCLVVQVARISGAGECLSDPCINGGICTEDSGAYTCDCPDMIYGTNCEEDQYYCVECLNNGTFRTTVQSCNSSSSDCLAEPGEDNCFDGTCVSSLHACHACDCPAEYTGLQCETENAAILLYQASGYNCSGCENNGSVIETVKSCSTAVSSTCLTEPGSDECIGGACVSSLHSCVCNCPSGYTGTACETVVVVIETPGEDNDTNSSLDTLETIGIVFGATVAGIVGVGGIVTTTTLAVKKLRHMRSVNKMNDVEKATFTTLPAESPSKTVTSYEEEDVGDLDIDDDSKSIVDEEVVGDLDIEDESNSIVDEEVVRVWDIDDDSNSIVDEEVVGDLDIDDDSESIVDEEVVDDLDYDDDSKSIVDEEVVGDLNIDDDSKSIVDEEVVGDLDIDEDSKSIVDEEVVGELQLDIDDDSKSIVDEEVVGDLDIDDHGESIDDDSIHDNEGTDIDQGDSESHLGGDISVDVVSDVDVVDTTDTQVTVENPANEESAVPTNENDANPTVQTRYSLRLRSSPRRKF